MHYTLDDAGWTTIYIKRLLQYNDRDLALLHTLRFEVFSQMLEPPVWNGTHTFVEGRLKEHGEERLSHMNIPRLLAGRPTDETKCNPNT